MKPHGFVWGFFIWVKPSSQSGKESREEGTNFLWKTEHGGGGSVDLWSQKAQGITYPDGFPKSPVALAHISSFLSKVTRQKTTSFASYQNGNVVFGL